MLKINNTVYDNYEIEVLWGKYTWKKETGLAPFIKFENDKFCIGLELRYSDVMFKETKLNIKKDITKYITDITYEDKKGWISLIISEYTCSITRIDNYNFKIEMNINSKDDNIIIKTNETIKIIN